MDRTTSIAAGSRRLKALLKELVDHVPIVILVRSARAAWTSYRSKLRTRTAFRVAHRLPRRYAWFSAVLLIGSCLDRATVTDASAEDEIVPRHVASALALVDRLDLANTDYAHGAPRVAWTAPVASHADCSGFIDELLKHDDGYGAEDFRRWFGSRRPTAERYHDAIVEGRGFERVATVESLRPGDLVAIKYLTRHDNTGHIMLVVEAPQSMRADPPFVPGANQWSVAVVDSSESGHGPTDTRYRKGAGGRDHDGLGRGVVRLYAATDGHIVGFAWSTSKSSRFVAPEDEDVVLGRPIPGFHP